MNTKLLGEFNSEFKRQMFSVLSNQLSGLFKSQSCKDFTLMGNYKMGSFVYDAILLTNTDVFVLEFKKNVAGSIYVNDSGWTSTGGLICSGNHGAINPWEQIKEKRNILYGLFRKKGFKKMFIKSIILFEKPFDLVRGNTSLNFENHKWFLTADVRNITQVLRQNSSSSAPVNFLQKASSVLPCHVKEISKENPRNAVNKLLYIMTEWWKKVA